MNEIENEAHPVYQTKLQLRPNFYTDSTFNSEVITLAELFNYRIPSNPNNKQILNARALRPSNEDKYKKIKLSLQGIYFNGHFETVFENKDVRSFTNLLYFDVDAKDNPGLDFNELRNAIKQLNYIIGVWTSFGGEGIGFVALANDIDSESIFINTHEQIRENISQLFGESIKWDENVCSIGRGCAVSYDPELWSNDNPEPFILNPDFKSKPKKKKVRNDQYNDIKFDPELKVDISLIEHFSFLHNNFYQNLIFTDVQTGLPIVKNLDFKYDSTQHRLQTYFDESIISTLKIKNEINTLAYHPDGFECIKIQMGESFYFPHKRRSKTLTVIMYNYLFINGLRMDKNEKNQIYNILLILNSRCVKQRPAKGQAPEFYPLEDAELNLLTTKIYNKYKANEIEPYVDETGTKSICTTNFISEWLKNNKAYAGNKHPRTLKLIEIMRLKAGEYKPKNEVLINELVNCYPCLNTSDYYKVMVEQYGFASIGYAKKIFHKYRKRVTPKH